MDRDHDRLVLHLEKRLRKQRIRAYDMYTRMEEIGRRIDDLGVQIQATLTKFRENERIREERLEKYRLSNT